MIETQANKNEPINQEHINSYVAGVARDNMVVLIRAMVSEQRTATLDICETNDITEPNTCDMLRDLSTRFEVYTGRVRTQLLTYIRARLSVRNVYSLTFGDTLISELRKELHSILSLEDSYPIDSLLNSELAQELMIELQSEIEVLKELVPPTI